MKRAFIILSTLATIIVFNSSCIRFDETIKGRGRSIEVFTDIDIRRVNEVIANSSIDVEIVPSDICEVIITAQENIIDFISVRISGNIARISYTTSNVNIRPTDVTKVTLFMPNIRSATTNGSGNIYIDRGFMTYSNIYLKTNGSGEIHLSNMVCRTMEITTNGSGDINISNIESSEIISDVKGSGDIFIDGFRTSYVTTTVKSSGDIVYRGISVDHSINIDGSGSVEAFDMVCESTRVNVRGSGNSYVWPDRYLDAYINGSGNIYYKGNPSIRLSEHGSGKLIRR